MNPFFSEEFKSAVQSSSVLIVPSHAHAIELKCTLAEAFGGSIHFFITTFSSFCETWFIKTPLPKRKPLLSNELEELRYLDLLGISSLSLSYARSNIQALNEMHKFASFPESWFAENKVRNENQQYLGELYKEGVVPSALHYELFTNFEIYKETLHEFSSLYILDDCYLFPIEKAVLVKIGEHIPTQSLSSKHFRHELDTSREISHRCHLFQSERQKLDWMVKEILSLLAQNPVSRIGILCSQQNATTGRLARKFEQAGLIFDDGFGTTLPNTALGSLATTWIAMLRGDLGKRTVLNFISQLHLKPDEQAKIGISSDWEQWCLNARVRRFDDVGAIERLKNITNPLCNDFIAFCLHIVNAVYQTTQSNNVIEASARELHKLVGEKTDVNVKWYNEILQKLSQWQCLPQYVSRIEMEIQLEFFQETLLHQTVFLPATAPKRLAFGYLDQLVGRGFTHIFILDFNLEQSIKPEMKGLLNPESYARSSDFRHTMKRELFWKLLESSQCTVLRDVEQTSEGTSLITELGLEFTPPTDLTLCSDIMDWQSSTPNVLDNIDRLAIQYKKQTFECKELNEYSGIVAAPSAGLLRLSPSRLETFARCSYQYFLRHEIGLKEEPDPQDLFQLPHMDKGTLAHHILFETLQTFKNAKDLDLKLNEVLQAFDSICAKAFEDYKKQNAQGAGPFWPLESNHLAHELREYLKTQLSDMGEWTIYELEQRFEKHMDDLNIALVGQYDRIDKNITTGACRIIDYKNSKGDLDKSNTFKKGQRIQIPLYMWTKTQDGSISQARFDISGEYHFLSLLKGFKITTVNSDFFQTHFELFKTVLAKLVIDLSHGNFIQVPGKNQENCRVCEFSSLCGREIASYLNELKPNNPLLSSRMEALEALP